MQNPASRMPYRWALMLLPLGDPSLRSQAMHSQSISSLRLDTFRYCKGQPFSGSQAPKILPMLLGTLIACMCVLHQ